MTFLFCDLVGSTQLSTRMDPEDLRELIAEYRQACTQAVSRYEGTIAQYYGDGILVYFGYPVAHEDDARRAVQSALDIVRTVHELGDRLRESGGEPISVRIGIHTGLAVVGDVGGPNQTERLAHGDTPNIAARIQGLAEPDTVIVSAATHRLVAGFFRSASMGPQALKGVSEPMEAFKVMGASGAHHRLEASPAAQLTPYVGREKVLRPLARAWEETCKVSGRVALLVGEAGVGKSRLVHVLRETIVSHSHQRLECFCSPYYKASALYPIAEMLRARMQVADEEDPKRQLAGLRAALERHGHDTEEGVALVAQLLGIPPQAGYSPPALHPVTQKQRTLEVLLSLILGLAERQPTLLVIEDVHWIDPTTLELLGALFQRIGTSRLLTVMTARPSFRNPWPENEKLVVLPVSDLSPEETEAMIRKISGGKTLPPEVLTLLVKKSDGNPLFVEEVTRMLLESGWLREGEDAYELAGPLPDFTVPTRLQDLLMARIDRMEPEAKKVMQLAATVGREFSFELLLHVLPGEEPAISHGLELLLAAGLVYAGGSGFSIKHALIQDAAYESLVKRTRQQYHAAIARALEGGFAATPTQPERIAQHLTRAHQPARAVPYWLMAGKHSVASSANEEAASHLQQGLDLVPSLPASQERDRLELDLLSTLGTALSSLKGYAAPEVAEVYARAEALTERVGPNPNLFWVLWGLWAFNLVKSDQKQSLALARRMMALARDQGESGLELEADFSLGLSHYLRGELLDARAHLERAVDAYLEEKHHANAFLTGQDVGVTSRSMASMVHYLLGDTDLAMERSRDAIDLARRLRHPFSQAYALGCAAWLHSYRREREAMAAAAKEAVDVSRAQAVGFWLLFGMIFGGRALVDAGEADAGIAQIESVLVPYRGFGSGCIVPYFLSQLAEARARRSDFDRALQDLSDARGLIAQSGEAFAAAEVERVEGDVRLARARARGDGLDRSEAAEIRPFYRRAVDIARGQGAKLFELRALTALARLGEEKRGGAEARGLLEAALGRMSSQGGIPDVDEARHVLGSLPPPPAVSGSASTLRVALFQRTGLPDL